MLTTTYSVTVTDAKGCRTVGTGTVNVNQLPVPDLSDDLTICDGESTTLSVENVFFGTAPFTYEWWNGADPGTTLSTTTELTVGPADLDEGVNIFFIRVTDANGCFERDVVMVTVVPVPVVTVAPETICFGETATLTAVAGGGNGTLAYEWSANAGSATTASVDVTPAVTTTYSVTVTSTYTSSDGGVTNCTDETSVMVTVNEKPVVEITDTDDNNITCSGEEVELIANATLGTGTYAYEWTANASPAVISTDAVLMVAPTETTTYTVKVTDQNGCTGTDEVTITVDPIACARLGDYVWEDTNGNGINDEPASAGVDGVPVNLKDETGTVIASTTTMNGGLYEFTNLVPGDYSVQFVQPAGFEFTQDGAIGSDEINDSDAVENADPAMDGMTEVVNLEEGENYPDLDAGIQRISNMVVEKDFISAVEQADASYDVTYEVHVINSGGIGTYSLTDTPSFDDDVTILSGNYMGADAGALNVVGATTLTTNNQIAADGTETYTLVYNVTLDLTPASTDGGDNQFTECGQGGPNGIGTPGEGLYNLVQLDVNSDGSIDDDDDACGNLPELEVVKNFEGIVLNADGTYTATYTVTVNNIGQVATIYDLDDKPNFDDDIVIESGSFSGEAAGMLATSGSTNLTTANDIAVGANETFNLTYIVSFDFNDAATPGDGTYTDCASGTPEAGGIGSGLENTATLTPGLAQPEQTSTDCGNIPGELELVKTATGVIDNGDGTYTATYTVAVTNGGGATETYSLTDATNFDDDIVIVGLTSNGTVISPVGGVYTLATGTTSIAAGETQSYALSFVINFDLDAADQFGDNTYDACEGGTPQAGGPANGLENTATLNPGNDQTDLTSTDCQDIPGELVLDKEFVSATPNEDGTYTVIYTVVVHNTAGLTETYNLLDTPGFDDDVIINGGGIDPVLGGVPGAGSTFVGPVSELTLAQNQLIASGQIDLYTITFNVTLDVEPTSTGGNNSYTPCQGGDGEGITGTPGTGLYNRADLEVTSNSQPDLSDDDCGDLPLFDLALDKNLVPAPAPYTQGSTVTYTVTVINEGDIDATNIEVTDNPEVGLLFSSINPQAGITSTGGGSFTIATLLAGGTPVTVTLNYTIDANFQGATLNNAAEITGDGPFDDVDSDPETGPDTDEDGDGDGDDDDEDNVDIEISQGFDLAIEKSLAPLQAPFTLSGATVNYQITITNEGSLDATNVDVMDDEPVGLNYLSADVFGTNVIANGGGSFTVPSLGQNESVTFTISYMTDGSAAIGQVLTNQIEITDDADGEGDDVTDVDSSPETSFDDDDLMDGVEDDDEDDVSITNIGINVEKVADRTTICAGEEVTYTLTVRFRDNICGPGLELREISVEDIGSDGFMRMLTPNDLYFVGASDPNGDGVLQCGEEFMWTYKLTHTETYTNTAMDMAEVWFVDPSQGDLFIGDAMFQDEVTITVDPNQCAKIGDFVWNDLDANGNQDAGEPGIPNVTVNLYASDDLGTALDTETTGPNGEYEFTGLTPGTYVVEFVNPDGTLWLSTPQDDGDTDLTDSDADPTTGYSQEITVVNGTDDSSIDAGFYQLAEVGDFVWTDTNGDGIQDMDGTEPGLPGVAVTLFDENGTQIDQVITGPNGAYLFTGLEPGDYAITVGDLPGYNYSPVNQGGNDAVDSDFPDGTTMVPVNLESGESDLTFDAGLILVCDLEATIADAAVLCNGYEDGTLTVVATGGTPGYTYLWSNGDTDATTTTGLAAGTYTVTVTDANGCAEVAEGTVTEPEGLVIDETITELNCNEVTGASIELTVTGGTTDYSFVWTGPGVVETEEDQSNLGVGTYMVKVTDANNCMATETYLIAPAASLEASIEDDAICPNTDQLGSLTVVTIPGNGNYSYLWDAATGNQVGATATDLAVGTYTVTVTDNDSDCSIEVTGEVVEDTEACVSLGDYVWLDDNEDGDQDDDEPGVPNVTVNLKDASGTVIATTTTDPDGFYIFEDFAPGTYSVQFVLPVDFLWTTLGAVAGANEDVDSDADPAMNGMTEEVVLEEGEFYLDLDAGIIPETRCELEAEVTIAPACNDNGTPTNPRDDFYTVTILVSGESPSGQWVTNLLDENGNPFMGTVNVPFTFELPVVQAGGTIEDITVIFSDGQDSECEISTSFTPTTSCSDQCMIRAEATSSPSCFDNDTPVDGSDDVFFIGITGFARNQAGSGWTAYAADGRVVGGGAYGVEDSEVGPFTAADLDGTQVVITVRDNDNNNCRYIVRAEIQANLIPCTSGCELSIEFVTSYCADNGTPFDTQDDVWYADVEVQGFGDVVRWTSDAVDGRALQFGRYTFGPFPNPVSAGDISINIRSFGSEFECEASTVLIAPGVDCSPRCDIEGEIFLFCDDNGTPNDPTDDVYFVTATASTVGTNNGDQGWRLREGNSLSSPIVGVGPIFGNTYTFGPFPLFDENGVQRTTVDYRIEDATRYSCRDNFLDTPLPGTCSPVVNCQLEVVERSNECDDQGTADDSDDTFVVTLEVSHSGDGTGYMVDVPGQGTVTGTYAANATVTLEFPIAGNDNVSLTFVDMNFGADCNFTITVEAPEACSPCELIVSEVTTTECDPGHTPFDGSDDTFTATFTVTGQNAGQNGWVTTDGLYSGDYGSSTTLTLPTGTDELILNIVDADDSDCGITVMIPVPDSCEEVECDLEVIISDTECFNNGTPTDGEDDYYSFTILATGVTGDYTLVYSSPVGRPDERGTFGVTETFSGIDRLTTVSAVIIPDDTNCDERVSLFVQATGECVDCQLEVIELSNECDDQGTADPSDDTFVVTLEVNHFGDGTAYIVNVPGQGTVIGVYEDSIVTIEFPVAGNESVMLTFMDITFQGACDFTIVVEAPETCSPCELTVTDVVETPCDDNGTPEDGSDDFFTATFTVSGENAGAIWVSQSNGMSFSGTYGEPFTLTLPTGTGNLTFEIVDADNANCGTSIEVEVPESCEVIPECELEATLTAGPVCTADGEGYTIEVTVTNNGRASAAGWVANNGAADAYDTPVTITVTDLCDDIMIIFTDADDALCTDTIIVSAPGIGIEAPADVDRIGDRDLICEDWTDIFGQESSLELTGNATTTGCGVESVTFSDAFLSGGPGTDPASCEMTVIQREFTATACNGTVVTDIQLITIRKPMVTDVIFPAGPVDFDCEGEGFPTDANGNPATSVTGIPAIVTVFGDTIRFDDVFCGTLSVSYSDEEEETCSGTTTITRTWTAVDACSDDVLTAEQTIRTGDFSVPIVTCPTSNHYCPVLENNIMLFPMDYFDCVANLVVPMPEVTDACSDSWTIITYVVDSLGLGDTLFVINEADIRDITLPAGDYVFRYRVTDDCGNVGTTDCIFRIADTQEPAAICISDINLSVGGYGIARVYNQMIDLGSYDNCGLDSVLVRRQILVDEVTGDTLVIPTWSVWGPYAEMNCNDAGSVVVMQLRVVDFGGNENICTTNVAVVDNTLPYCTGLEDIFLTCTNVPAGIDLTDTVDLQNTFGTPVVIDNCAAGAIELSPIVDLDECLGAGTVTRRWLAIDRVGNVSPQEFTQVITVTADLGFTLVIPKDTITDCLDAAQGFDVFGLGCADISVTFKDTLVEILAADGDACMVIERQYTVINNCVFDPATDTLTVISRDEDCDGLEGESVFYGIVLGDSTYVDIDTTFNNAIPAAGTRGTECTGETNRAGHLRSFANTGGWSYTQRIVIFDDTNPILDFDVPEIFCATEESDCEAVIEIPITVLGECTAAGANWLVLIDLDRGGNRNKRLPVELEVKGTFPNYFITAAIPIGAHSLMVRYTDGCNNAVAVAIPFEVVDCSIPDPICYSGLIANLNDLETPVVGTDGELIESGVMVEAGRLASCNVEDCSGPLRFSVNRIGDVPHVDSTSVLLTCDDRYTVDLEVYMWDSAFNPIAVQPDGTIGGPNWKVCTVEVLVQDPDLVCDDCNADGSLTLGGGITILRGITLPGVEIELSGGAASRMAVSDTDGTYAFPDVDAGSYTITPYKEDGASNGISTLDELILQRHLLGLELITDPLIFMAADLNNSGTLTVIDRLLMRNLILGNTEVLPDGETWRFVPVSYFDGSNDIELGRTMEAPRSIKLSDIESCLSGNNFYAVKKGDLNNSVFISTFSGTILNGTRGRSSNDTHPLEIEEHHLRGGDFFDLPVRVGDIEQLAGLQFTLGLASDALEIEEVIPGLMDQSQLGLTQISRGYVSAAWTQKEEVRAGDAVLFTIRLRSLRPISISNAVSFVDNPTYSEAYRIGTEELVDLVLKVTPVDADTEVFVSGPRLGLESGVVLSQNFPNPFVEETTISFTLPEAGEATINVYDLNGRVVKEFSGAYTAGEHAVKLQGKNFPVETFIYTLTFNGQRLTRTMLRIR
jgi:uncharacterized repeat protein (TIGR01451 family)